MLKEGSFVIATVPINGIADNSVGLVNSISDDGASVLFIGKNEVARVSSDALKTIDIEKTGKSHKHKICNICHILKPTDEFAKNQTDAKQQSTTRPSCKVCRIKIEGKSLTKAEKERMENIRPPDKTVFVCPICRKRTIVGITVKIVRDHDHRTGAGRDWICDSCNTGLGRFKDDTKFFEGIILYLEKFEDKAED